MCMCMCMDMDAIMHAWEYGMMLVLGSLCVWCKMTTRSQLLVPYNNFMCLQFWPLELGHVTLPLFILYNHDGILQISLT